MLDTFGHYFIDFGRQLLCYGRYLLNFGRRPEICDTEWESKP